MKGPSPSKESVALGEQTRKKNRASKVDGEEAGALIRIGRNRNIETIFGSEKGRLRAGMFASRMIVLFD